MKLDETAGKVRDALEAGEVIEVALDVGRAGGPLGLLFVPLDFARINADPATARILPDLGIAADWALVWTPQGEKAAPFRLLELAEHDAFTWAHVSSELNLFSDDAKVVAAFLAAVARVPSDVPAAVLA